MSRSESSLRPVELAVQIDRLVDQELSECDRRTLLLELDRHPDGWKRCSLAFLEAQAWTPAIRELAQEHQNTAEPSGSGTIPPPDSPPVLPRSGHRWRGLLLAACLLTVVFGLGVISGTRIVPPTPRRPIEQADTTPGLEAEPSPAPRDPVRLAGFVRLAGLGGDPNASIPIPVLSGQKLDEQLASHPSPVVPEYVRGVWQRQGYECQQKREVVSVGLDDGRSVAIPVDQIRLRYVGHVAY